MRDGGSGAPQRQTEAPIDNAQELVEKKAGAELDALAMTLDDQIAFAKLSRQLLEDLELATAEDFSDDQPDEADSALATDAFGRATVPDWVSGSEPA